MRLFLAALAAAISVAAPSFSQQQRAADMRLVDAGFKMRAAVTAEQLEHLRKLPPRRFVPQAAAGRRYYLYADPDDCKCVFVGDDNALQTYRDMPKKSLQPDAVGGAGGGHPADEILIHDMNQDFSGFDLFNHPF